MIMDIGDKITGTIKSIESYGLYIDCNDENSYLLHLTDVSWDHLSYLDLLNMFRVGDEIEANVIMYRDNKVALSIKSPSTAEELQNIFHQKYKLYDELELEVTSIKDYGVFFKVMEGFEGFLHYNDFKNRKFELKEVIKVKISSLEYIDMRRISLELAD